MNPLTWLRRVFHRLEPAAVQPQPRGAFLHGVNLPWIQYGCDFGANAWQPGGGMARQDRRDALSAHLRALAEADIRVVRWFMLCDGRAGLNFNDDEISLDACIFPDVDAALQEARDAGIKVMFVLFDFKWLHVARLVNGVQLGGLSRYITKSTLRGKLLEDVVRPLLARYGKHPAIHSWDVFNEPEWILRGIGTARWTGTCSLKSFRVFADRVVDIIHEETVHPVTLGLARRSSLTLFRDCALDFFQVHWYDGHSEEVATPLHFHAPVVLGEFPTAGSRLSVPQILHAARAAGFTGAFAWSARDTVTLSSLQSFLAGLREFRSGSSEEAGGLRSQEGDAPTGSPAA